MLPLLPLFLLPFYYLVYAYIKVHVTNYTVNNAQLGEHQFESRMKTLPYLWIFFSNMIVSGADSGAGNTLGDDPGGALPR